MRVNLRLVGTLLVLVASPVAAQVGHPPSDSPYRDFSRRQELTFFGGWFSGSEGDANVGPQGGPVLGARYEFRVGGPVFLTGRLTGIATERLVVDPEEEDLEDRELGTIKFPMLLADVGLTLAITGRKTWHRIMPVVHASAGILSDLGKEVDVGGFSIGTPFALSVGTGVRYVPGGRVAVRVDVTDHLFRIRYPAAYFVPPSEDSEPVLSGSASRSQWLHNPTITFGVSYHFGR
jgi:hypothetical protein